VGSIWWENRRGPVGGGARVLRGENPLGTAKGLNCGGLAATRNCLHSTITKAHRKKNQKVLRGKEGGGKENQLVWGTTFQWGRRGGGRGPKGSRKDKFRQ